MPEDKCPKWEGQDLADKSLYIYYAAGIGDAILFSRYLPLINKEKAGIYLHVQPPLRSLFKDSRLDTGLNAVESEEEIKSVHFDYQISLMSLANVFKTNRENVPCSEGYIKANPQKTANYKKSYFDNDKFKIGIAWQSSQIDNIRSISHISSLYPLLRMKNVEFYSLQKGFGEIQLLDLPDDIEITDLAPTFSDFSDTAAAIENLDLVITVDTSIANLAPAMGKFTFIILPAIVDWKWDGNDSEHTSWYKKVKIFRQADCQQRVLACDSRTNSFNAGNQEADCRQRMDDRISQSNASNQESGNWDEVVDRIINDIKDLI